MKMHSRFVAFIHPHLWSSPSSWDFAALRSGQTFIVALCGTYAEKAGILNKLNPPHLQHETNEMQMNSTDRNVTASSGDLLFK